MFGLDAPKVVKNLTIQGLLWSLAGVGLQLAHFQLGLPYSLIFTYLFYGALLASSMLLGTACIMLVSSYFLKPWLVRTMMRKISWPNNASIVDIGCGRGLCLVVAARNAPDCHALVGIDIWNPADLHKNSQKAAFVNMKNYISPSQMDRLTLYTMDARALEFQDASFDVVVSSLALHNIDGEAEQNKALEEMLRITKPGGSIAILDIMRVDAYKTFLLSQGATLLYASPMYPLYCLSTKYIIFKK